MFKFGFPLLGTSLFVLFTASCGEAGPESDLGGGQPVTVMGYERGPDGAIVTHEETLSASAYAKLVAEKQAWMEARQTGGPAITTTKQALYVGTECSDSSGCSRGLYTICRGSDVWMYNVRSGWGASTGFALGCFRGSGWDILMSATFTYQGVKQTWYDAAMSLWAGEFSGWVVDGNHSQFGFAAYQQLNRTSALWTYLLQFSDAAWD